MVCDSRVDEVRKRIIDFALGLTSRGHNILPLLSEDIQEEVKLYSFKVDVMNRTALEEELARRLGRTFSVHLREIMSLLGDPPRVENIPPEFWTTANTDLKKVLVPILSDIFIAQAESALAGLPYGVDWALVNMQAVDWARQYAFDLVAGLDRTSRDVLQRSISSFYENGLTRGQLEGLLSGTFGPVRAEMIAVTEVTRASSMGEMALREELRKSGIEMVPIWNTSNDELVCAICGPRNQKPEGEAWQEPPPAHPRCRCWIDLEIPKNV